ncbi:MAG: hypothetical protein ACJAVR_003873 [Paracoccaceae bacterium]|jgi:hypothetical protein
MATFEDSDGTHFISSDEISKSVPWRLMDYEAAGAAGALTDEQVQEIAVRFEFDRNEIERLSIFLAHMLNPRENPMWVPIDRTVATARANKELERAHAEISAATRQLAKAAKRLETLSASTSEKNELRMERLKLSIGQASVHAGDAVKELQAIASTRDFALVLSYSRKGRARDLHRRAVIFAVTFIWDVNDRNVTYTTDSISGERRGQFIDFTNAVVACVTDPPTTLPAETIVSELRVLRRST